MKIEMAESLFMSWLKHIKGCQIVQTNWKASPTWDISKKDELNSIMEYSASVCNENFGIDIYKKNASLDQLIAQAEIDVFGIKLSQDSTHFYAVDVAFHEAGLNYGSKEETVSRVIKKIIRTGLCLYGYLGNIQADIIFASPKTHSWIYDNLIKSINIIEQIFLRYNIYYKFNIITDKNFNTEVLSPVMSLHNIVMDTSELFLRSIQLEKMFSKNEYSVIPSKKNYEAINDSHSEIKVGKLAQTELRQILESGIISFDEIKNFQTLEYSKRIFKLNFALLLIDTGQTSRPDRYYKNKLSIHGTKYFMTSEWYDKNLPDLKAWIVSHKNN